LIQPYIRDVHYYETDQMSIVHHSNYIRWFEEARLNILEQCGVRYDEIEKRKILIPVVDISCKYHVSAKYGDRVSVCAEMTQYNGVKLCFAYTVKNAVTEEVLASGTSTHCFLNENRRPISLKRQDPQLHALFLSMSEAK